MMQVSSFVAAAPHQPQASDLSRSANRTPLSQGNDTFHKAFNSAASASALQFSGACNSRPASVSPMELLNASAHNLSKAKVRELLQEVYIDASDGHDNTAVMTAVKRGDKRMTRILASLRADVMIPNDQQDFPLKEAAIRNRADIVQVLAEDSLAPGRFESQEDYLAEMLNQKDKAGRTALMCAANAGYGTVVSRLLSLGANATETDNKHQTARTIAINRRNAVQHSNQYTQTQRQALMNAYTNVITILTAQEHRTEQKQDDP